MRLVVIESPYTGNTALNLRYLRACMADCLRRGEAPFASHGLYTQPGVLDDAGAAQRRLGMDAGFAWRAMAEATIVYTDLGVSRGMIAGLQHAQKLVSGGDHAIEYREIGGEWTEIGGEWTAAPSNADDNHGPGLP